MAYILYYAIPAFVILLVFEYIYAKRHNLRWHYTKDSLVSITMGIGNVLIGILAKLIVLGAYYAVYQFRIFELGFHWWVWVLLFFAEDLTYYVFHRFSHEIRYFWASHVVHHSSEYYNLATALRQTWTGHLSGAFIFWLWLPFLGFHPLMVAAMQSISLIYQFWIHTESIRKLPHWFETVFNTPSHHRVHHSSDVDYLDQNHAGVLIIWDKLFGTFTAERENTSNKYGLTENIRSFNPFWVAFHEWIQMYLDVKKARSGYERWMYLFGPPGWAPGEENKSSKALKSKKSQIEDTIHGA